MNRFSLSYFSLFYFDRALIRTCLEMNLFIQGFGPVILFVCFHFLNFYFLQVIGEGNEPEVMTID
jgi:hypothetical protein